MLLKTALLIFSIDFTKGCHFLQIFCHRAGKVLISPKDCPVLYHSSAIVWSFNMWHLFSERFFFFLKRRLWHDKIISRMFYCILVWRIALRIVKTLSASIRGAGQSEWVRKLLGAFGQQNSQCQKTILSIQHCYQRSSR